jgi:hypothetical protein
MVLVARFREDLEYCDSGNFRVGAMCDVRDMLFVTFQGSPTFWWHKRRMSTCCDSIAHHGTHRQIYSIQPSCTNGKQPATVQAQAQKMFRGKMVHGGGRCTSGEGCT